MAAAYRFSIRRCGRNVFLSIAHPLRKYGSCLISDNFDAIPIYNDRTHGVILLRQQFVKRLTRFFSNRPILSEVSLLQALLFFCRPCFPPRKKTACTVFENRMLFFIKSRFFVFFNTFRIFLRR